MPTVAIGFVGVQIPRDSKLASFNFKYAAKQSELYVVADISNISVLHGINQF